MNAAVCSDTILQCPTCYKRYRVADGRLRKCGYRVRCGGCREVFDARSVRLNPAVCSPQLIKENKRENEFSLPWPVCPGVTVCGENVDEYTKIERVASVDDSSCLIGGVTQLGAFTLMDDSLTTFDSSSFSSDSGGCDPGNVPLDVRGIKHVVLGAHEGGLSAQVSFDKGLRTFSEAFRCEGKKARINVAKGVLSRFFIVTIVFAALAVFYERDEFVGFFPGSYNFLQRVSAFFGKTVVWPHSNWQISLRAVEMRLDQQDAEKLVLTGVLSNRSYQNLSFPSLEITFLDSDGVVLRKEVLPPSSYIGDGRVNLGFAARSQIRFSSVIKNNNLIKVDGFQVSLK
ncbi:MULTISPECIES: zinc-ribbon and DUF3426 domain-containing protein [Candidatus Ichthyocystis]|uniref:Putative membrane protein, DUF3426 domain n=1 Tax=Candidatus Ichthyocystis hellenicum TaxID=1561003 RepID=A0A0S4M0H9_9BURK|nr:MULTISPECIES: zinc-ribbon and DUF3426 domain-containing protein [Ichthyocystis]CUT17317.1 putative membrane protein, DUF3426 domain [Candidatus Ichthyocystis hellenicum]